MLQNYAITGTAMVMRLCCLQLSSSTVVLGVCGPEAHKLCNGASNIAYEPPDRLWQVQLRMRTLLHGHDVSELQHDPKMTLQKSMRCKRSIACRLMWRDAPVPLVPDNLAPSAQSSHTLSATLSPCTVRQGNQGC